MSPSPGTSASYFTELPTASAASMCPFRRRLSAPGGIVSGQVFMAAADVAMWLAIKTRLGMADASVTAEMKTNFLGGAKREGFRCTAKVLKLGRRLIYGVAECVDSNDRLLTHHTVTYIRAEQSAGGDASLNG